MITYYFALETKKETENFKNKGWDWTILLQWVFWLIQVLINVEFIWLVIVDTLHFRSHTGLNVL